jgi:hypothetical protein
MNNYKNARLTFVRRQNLAADMVDRQMTPAADAVKRDVGAPTARMWLGRFLAQMNAHLGVQTPLCQRHLQVIEQTILLEYRLGVMSLQQLPASLPGTRP